MRRRKKIRVLICNRYTLFREGIKAMLPETDPIDIVGEARTTKQIMRMVGRLHPDVVLMDATTPDSSGAEATRRIKATHPGVQVLILSLDDNAPLISDCIRAGAAGHIPNDAHSPQLSDAIHTLCGQRRAPTSGAAGMRVAS